jgi:hypothetical protein
MGRCWGWSPYELRLACYTPRRVVSGFFWSVYIERSWAPAIAAALRKTEYDAWPFYTPRMASLQQKSDKNQKPNGLHEPGWRRLPWQHMNRDQSWGHGIRGRAKFEARETVSRKARGSWAAWSSTPI